MTKFAHRIKQNYNVDLSGKNYKRYLTNSPHYNTFLGNFFSKYASALVFSNTHVSLRVSNSALSSFKTLFFTGHAA